MCNEMNKIIVGRRIIIFSIPKEFYFQIQVLHPGSYIDHVWDGETASFSIQDYALWP